MRSFVLIIAILFAVPSFAYTDCTPDLWKYRKIKRGMNMFNTSMILGCDGEIVDEVYIGDRLQTHFQWDAYGFNNAFIYIIMENDRIVRHYAKRIKRNPEGW